MHSSIYHVEVLCSLRTDITHQHPSTSINIHQHTKTLFESLIKLTTDQQQGYGRQVVGNVELQQDLWAKELAKVIKLTG